MDTKDPFWELVERRRELNKKYPELAELVRMEIAFHEASKNIEHR